MYFYTKPLSEIKENLMFTDIHFLKQKRENFDVYQTLHDT